MGDGYIVKCAKCGYKYEAMLGIGMMFPIIYKSTVSDIRAGKYGDDYKRFFEEHINAAVNCENKTAVCTECGKMDTVMDMGLYLPKEDGGEVCNIDFITPDELKKDFRKYMKYENKCASCGGKMKNINLISRLQKGTIKCPECGERLELDETLFVCWD